MDNELILNEKERKKEKRKLYRDIVFIILFGLLIIWFTGSFLANRNNIENNDNEIKTELAIRSNRTMKQANRKNVDIINYQLNYFNSSLNTLELNYKVCDVYLNDFNGEYSLYNNLSLTYDLNTNLFTYCEFEIEFSEGAGNVYFLESYIPNNFINYLNSYDTSLNAKIFTSTSYDEISLLAEEDSGNIIFENYFTLGGDTFGTIQFFGQRFVVSDIIFEVQATKNLINAKFNDGKAVGENIGYNDGYDKGYDKGYLDGQQSGYDRGYDEGLQEGYLDGSSDGYQSGYQSGYQKGLVASEGYQTGYDEGYDVGHDDGYDVGYDDGEEDGYHNGYDKGLVNGQKDTINEKGFKTLFNSILNAPYNIFKGILNFEFLGVNLFSLFSFIFTTMLILWIVKIFKK